MPSSTTDNALRDILRHIDLAGQFVAGFDWAAFHDDVWDTVRRALPPLWAVVEQELERG